MQPSMRGPLPISGTPLTLCCPLPLSLPLPFFPLSSDSPEAASALSASTPKLLSQGSLLRGTALLVEDDRINLLAITRCLQAAGCTVETAVNGQEGVDKARQGVYDIIFMGAGRNPLLRD